MTRNDSLFIEDWIKYHGLLFGYDNLHLIDGSDDPDVLALYERYKERGLNVFHTKANLNELEGVINEQIHAHKGEDGFVIKVDTDEFLAHPDYAQAFGWKYRLGWAIARFLPKLSARLLDPICLRNDRFDDLFRKLKVSGQRYETSDVYNSIGAEGGVTAPARQLLTFRHRRKTLLPFKSFFHAQSFRMTDLGGHRGLAKRKKGCIPSPLTILHYHKISVEESIQRARRVLISHQYICEDDDRPTLIAKLSKLAEGDAYNSSHKVEHYLYYLQQLEAGKRVTMDTLYAKLGKVYEDGLRELSLIRDTLEELDAKAAQGD